MAQPEPFRDRQKNTFKTLFIMLSIILMVLPFITTFNEFLTVLAMKVGFYRFIESLVVPWETRIVALLLSLFGIHITATPTSVFFSDKYNVLGQNIVISWNCIGWQSFVLLFLSFFTGLQGSYTKGSKIECALIALLGTFMMNIIRITLVILVAHFWGAIPAIVFHDYGSILMTASWLLFFWWFAYAYVLEPSYYPPGAQV